MSTQKDEETAHDLGYQTAAREITEGKASFAQAKERGFYPNNQDLRIAWDAGYEEAVCAYRLGHDVQDLSDSGLYGISPYRPAFVIFRLLDGQWEPLSRPDPRRSQ